VRAVVASRFELRAGERDYPACLLASPRPPKVLYGIGDPGALRPGLAIVGSRKATPYGLACARAFSAWAGERGVTIVSGAAIGCDLAAQVAALEAGGSSIAVLGCGADVDYPVRSRSLLGRLRAGDGAVVSELAWGTPPLRGHFPARNRIIAALSMAVLVVEAALPSGTFSTADHALDAGRGVLAVPGSVFFSGSAGCNRLLRQGAGVVGSVADLADELASLGLVSEDVSADASPSLAPVEADDALLRAVLADPTSLDGLCVALGLAPADVSSRLSWLEAQGRVARYPDGRYGPCGGR
jgi:DNA processing protein